MMVILFILFITNISIFFSYDNPAALPSNYPFSYKIDNFISVIFMEDQITLFDVAQIQINAEPLDPHPLGTGSCISREEKGGIFLNNYYYTSCLISADDTSFQIKVYDDNFALYKTFPSNTDNYHFTSGSIRFFKKNTSPELLGVAWIDNGQFIMIKIDHDSVKQYRHYPVSHMARDIDCIFITKHDRIVCLLGIEKNEKYTCSANLFTYNEDDDDIFISNLKTWYVCTNHQSRKIRADTSGDADSDIFFYYFVDTNNEAYVIKMQLLNTVTITIGAVLKVMSGCDENQHSFDMAGDTFMGYNVFICVESRFKKIIKIQLFKIEDDKIIFYENRDVDNPYEYNDGFNSEISMINFVVLKNSLNFGFLSYRTANKPYDYYTIFNQPECDDFEISMMGGDLYQNKEIDLNFNPVIKNDNYEGGIIEIISTNPGMALTVLPSGTVVRFISKDYITGNLEFIFRVRNYFYASENCKATIKVKDCFRNCETCTFEGADFFMQLCEGCKEGNYPIFNFPKDYYDNCCQKDVDCPDYLYLDSTIYRICDISCLACDGGSYSNCITCYNEYELKKYLLIEQGYINAIKHETITTWFYWENEERRKCVNRDGEPYIYLDEEVWTYLPCYKSCEKCRGAGNIDNHNCTRCYEDSNYFHFESKDSENCFNKDEVPHNYYRYDGDYYTGETIQNRYWTPCYNLCYSCKGGNHNECTKCATNAYPKCNEKELNYYECFDSIPDVNYFFDEQNNCYQICDTNCLTCDNTPESLINNCLTCETGKILFNRNCYENCPLTHYELDHRKCVSQCPDYTIVKISNLGLYNEYKQCFNCAEIGKCIYLGTQNTDPNLKSDCISCILAQTFISNEDYGILDDCYSLCDTCSQRGTVTQMNCNSCKNSAHCLVDDYGNCVPPGTIVDNYYMDNTGPNCVYHKCYRTCKFCSGDGNSLNHKCLLCENNYQFDIINPGNCVSLCQQYWYIDVNTQELICVNEERCPTDYPYLVKLTKECVPNCSYNHYSGGVILFKFRDTCLLQCPSNTMPDNIDNACYHLDDVQDVFNYATNYIKYYYINYNSVNNLLIYSSDRKMYFHLYNTTDLGIKTYNESSINVGTSITDFSECLENLRAQYGYGDDEIFYIGILDVIRDDTSSSQFEYIIHDHLGNKLNNGFCLDNNIPIYKSLIHSNDTFTARDTLEIYGIDVSDYNNKNSFFCDICFSFDYNPLDPYDVLLNDRYKYYYKEPDYYFCENTCDSDSTKIDLENNRVQCICKGKNDFTSYQKEKFQKFSKSSQKCKDWFMQYLKCYKNVFSKDLFGNNIGNYFIFFFILFQILSLLIFFLFSRKPIIKHIREIYLKKSKNGYIKEDIELANEIQTSKKGSKTSISNKSGSKNTNNANSKANSKEGSKNEIKSEEKKSNKSGSTHNLSHKSGSKKSKSGGYNNSQSNSFSEEKSKNSNPPKNENNKYKFISDENENKKDNNNIYNLNPNAKNGNQNKIFTKYITPNDNIIKNKEEQKINQTQDHGAPKPFFQRYAKRFLQNRKDYVDNEYREDSYDFDLSKIPKDKRKKIEEFDYEENEQNEEENEKEQKNGENENNNEGKENEKGKDDKDGNKKKDKLSEKALAEKKEKEEFKEEIRRFKKLKFIDLYWFILQKRHRIISLFIQKDVYDIFSIKLSLLILSYTIDIFITTFFFFNFEISYLFHEKKHTDPYYIIFMGIIDTLASTILIRVVDFLVEFRKKLKKFDREEKLEKNKNYYDLINDTVNALTKKIIIYYSINFVFSLIVWYIVSAFIGTYRYIKLCWGIIIGVIFALSNLFPFIYYLVIVSLQYNGIHNKRFKLYKFAMIMLKI